MKARFTVLGPPQGKGRPRVVRLKNGASKTYTPSKTVEYENSVKIAYSRKFGNRVLYEKEVALKMTIAAFMPVPKSTPKRDIAKMHSENWPHTKRGDVSNIAKCVEDALNGLAYWDDGQISVLTVMKFYSAKPRVEVEIEELEVTGR